MTDKTPSPKEVLRRLYAIANGADVSDPTFGVCKNVDGTNEDSDLCVRLILDLYESCWPIGRMLGELPPWEEFDRQGRWMGRRGHYRRILAGIVAAELEWRLKHGIPLP